MEHPLADMEMPEGNHVFEAVAKPPAKIYTIGHSASKHQFFKSIRNKLGCVPTPFGIKQPEVGDMKRFEGPLKMGSHGPRADIWLGPPERMVEVQAVQMWHIRPRTWPVRNRALWRKGHTEGHGFEPRK